MRRLTIFGALLLLLGTAGSASAHHGMVTWECGTHVINQVDEYTKGRTDALIHHVDMTAGCHRLIFDGVTAAGLGEAQGNDEQTARCQRDGKVTAVNTFNYAGHIDVNPDGVKVECRKYRGHD